MKIEVWSDFVCPFCYMGKRKLENALKQFGHEDKIAIEFKSYQLDPDAKNMPGKNFYETFSQLKGVSLRDNCNESNKLLSRQKQLGLHITLIP